MWVMVDGDRTQVVTTLGAREGVFVEVSEDRPWWAVKQDRNAKGEIVTRSVELTEELMRIVENVRIFNDGKGDFVGRIVDPTAPVPSSLSSNHPPPLGAQSRERENAEFDREWPEGEQRPPVRLVEQSGVPPRLSGDAGTGWTHADGAPVNPVAAKILDGVASALFVDRDAELRITWGAMEQALCEASNTGECGPVDFATIAGPDGPVRELRLWRPRDKDTDTESAMLLGLRALVSETSLARMEVGSALLSVSYPLPIRAKSSADKPEMSVRGPGAGLSLNDMRAIQEEAPLPLTLPVDDRLAGLQKLRDRVAADPADPQAISKESLTWLLDCAIMAERTAAFLEELRILHRKSHARNRIHSMDTPPPEDGVYVVWQKWPAETPLAGVAPTLRTFAGGRWSARGGSDAGWSFVPKGVL